MYISKDLTKYENYVQHALGVCTSRNEWDSMQRWSLLVQATIPTNEPESVKDSLLALA